MKTIYKTLKQSTSSIDSDSDLKFWEDWHGPGMAMEWPSFIEYNPEAKKTQRPKPSRPQNKEVYRLTKVFWFFDFFPFLYSIPLTCLKVEESLQMFNDVTNNVIIPAAGAKSSENLKLEIIRTLEQLNYQGNCQKTTDWVSMDEISNEINFSDLPPMREVRINSVHLTFHLSRLGL